MDKVDELVEWVARTICKYGECCNWRHCTLSGSPAHECSSVGKAKRILSHPDLALIEDCECGGNGYEEGGDGAPSWHVVCGKCADTGRKVIPLAEALKEVTSERT